MPSEWAFVECTEAHRLIYTFQTAGVTFAAVHDSYWTHASSIDPMSKFIRDTFIELHSSDVLQRLEAEVNALSMFSHTLPYRSLF